MTLQEELLELKKGFWTLGPDVWHRHCDDTCLVAFAEMSGVMTRNDIARTAEEGRWRDVAMLPRGLIHLGSDAVILTYEASATRQDDTERHAVISSGYIRRPDGWKLAFHQHTAKQPEGVAPAPD